jgi:hypothetical protein
MIWRSSTTKRDDEVPYKPKTVEEAKLIGRKDAAESTLTMWDTEELKDGLEILRECTEAGMELQMHLVMRETGWTREKVLETLAIHGSTTGFPDMVDGDPYDLENWIESLRSINNVISYLRWREGPGSEEDAEEVEGSEDEEDAKKGGDQEDGER